MSRPLFKSLRLKQHSKSTSAAIKAATAFHFNYSRNLIGKNHFDFPRRILQSLIISGIFLTFIHIPAIRK
jgi:hypothetical protein